MQVKLYALTTCPYCRMVKRFLDDGSIEYELTEVDTLEGEEKEDVIAEVRRISGGGASFPVIVVDDEVIVGFNKKRIKELLNL